MEISDAETVKMLLVHNVTLNGPVVRGRVCLNVTYVEGHELAVLHCVQM